MRRGRGLVIAALCVLCAGCGPHMDKQPSIRPWEQQMPGMPAGTVATSGTLGTLTAQASRTAASPVPATRANISNGRIFYGYYCLMCHGDRGRGDGPVGQSYVPRPTDLTSARVTGMTDGQLYAGMLTGIGHSPVMEETVPTGQRWPIVLFVRSLSRGIESTTAPSPRPGTATPASARPQSQSR